MPETPKKYRYKIHTDQGDSIIETDSPLDVGPYTENLPPTQSGIPYSPKIDPKTNQPIQPESFFDANGQTKMPPGGPVPPATTSFSDIPKPSRTIVQTDPEFADYFRYLVGSHLPTAATIAGAKTGAQIGKFGGVPGTVAGTVLGGFLGNLSSQEIQNQNPRWFGDPGHSATSGEGIGEAALSSLLNEIPGLAGLLKRSATGVKGAIIKKIFPERGIPEVSSALKDPALGGVPENITYGQAAQNPGAQKFENIFAGKKANVIHDVEQAEMAKLANKNLSVPEEDIVKRGAAQAKTTSDLLAARTKNLYQDFDAARDTVPSSYNYVKTTQPSSSGSSINSFKPATKTLEKLPQPIELSSSYGLANSVQQDLENSLQGVKIVDAPTQKLLNTLHGVTQTDPVVDSMGQPVQNHIIPYDKARALKDAIGEYIAPKLVQGLQNTREVGVLNGLKKTLSYDIDQGIQKWGPDVYNKYSAAKDSYIDRANRVRPDIAQHLLGLGIDPKITYEMIGKEALSSSGDARQFLNITGDRSTLSNLAIRKLYDTGFDTASQKLNPSKILNEIDSNPEVYKTAIPSQQLSNTKELMRRLQAQSANENVGGFGKFAVTAAKGRLALGIPLSLMAGHLHPIAGMATGGTTALLIGADSLAKLMATPGAARALLEGTRIPMQQSALTTRIILQSLRGVSLTAQDPDGREYPVDIGNGGKVSVRNF